MRKIMLAASAIVLAFSIPATAADLATPAMPFKAAALAVPDIWSGCYAGMEASSTGGNNISGSPGAGGWVGCLTRLANGITYGYDVDAVATKLSAPVNLSSPLTMGASVRVGYTFHPGLGTVLMVPFNDVYVWAGAAGIGSEINGITGSNMQGGWMVKGGLDTVLTYNNIGQAQTTMGFQYRRAEVDNLTSNTWLVTLSTRIPPLAGP